MMRNNIRIDRDFIFNKSEEYKEKLVEYIENVDNNKIIEYIEYLFDPEIHDIHHIKMDDNFGKSMYEFMITDSVSLQIWCDGPVLLKKLNLE